MNREAWHYNPWGLKELDTTEPTKHRRLRKRCALTQPVFPLTPILPGKGLARYQTLRICLIPP